MADNTLAQLEAEAQIAVSALGVPPCPHVLSKIGRELRHEAPDVHRIAELITHDATCSAVILKTANSALDASRSKARSVQQAIAHLGPNQASYLLASLMLRNVFAKSNNSALLRFWDISTELALCAAYLAGELGTVDRDEAHTYALFRDFGSAVLICKFDDYDEARLLASAGPGSNIAVAEKARFGTDHAAIGAGLARDWQLPEEMIEAITWHHAEKILERDVRRLVSDEALRLIAIGALSDRIVEDYEGKEADDAAGRLTVQALRALDLPAPQFEELQAGATELLDQMDINAMPTIRLLRPGPGRRPGE